MDSICEKSVQIGMRMVVLLADGHEIFWPWNSLLEQLKLDKFGDNRIETFTEVYGDVRKMEAIVAHINPKTYEVLGIEYSKDYKKMWKKRVPEESLPIIITGERNIMDRLDPASLEFMPDLKALSIDLLLLFGHSRDFAERWIQEDSEGGIGYAQFGLDAILYTIYATFTVLGEGKGSNENGKPKFPNFDNEPLDQFRSDLRVFINDLN
jgi:hypothetical protein